jgi:O-antigen ligase
VVDRIQGTEVRIADGGASESIEARSEAARTALAIVRDYPLVGTGGGSFYNIFLSYRSPQYEYSFVDHTHNDFVEIATDFGLTGLGILGLLVALTLGVALRTLATRRITTTLGHCLWRDAMATTALLIHSTVDFNLQVPANALTIVVVLAMAWSARTLPSSAEKPRTAHFRATSLA